MKKSVLITTVLGASLALFSATSYAGDAAAGKAKAGSCAGCHGSSGVSANGMYPNLAGQQEKYLVKQLKDFRDGKRKDPLMGGMAKPLSDADIDNLAAYYASLK